MCFLSVAVAEGMPNLMGKCEVHFLPPPMRKEHQVDLLTRLLLFWYPEIVFEFSQENLLWWSWQIIMAEKWCSICARYGFRWIFHMNNYIVRSYRDVIVIVITKFATRRASKAQYSHVLKRKIVSPLTTVSKFACTYKFGQNTFSINSVLNYLGWWQSMELFCCGNLSARPSHSFRQSVKCVIIFNRKW